MMQLSDYDITLIEKNLDHELSIEEKKEFQQKVESSESFAAQWQRAQTTLADLKHESLKKEMRTIYYQSKEDTVKRINYKRISLVAASVVILMTLGLYWINVATQHDRLYQAYYEVYPPNPNLRGEQEDTQSAMEHYRRGDYQKALVVFLDKYSKRSENEDLAIYIGNCYLELNQPYAAIEYFSLGTKNQDKITSHNNQWYLALAYLKNDQVKLAKNVLNHIIDQNQLFSPEATILVQELE
ncbi:hypothetical protein [Reichenbachiella sp.]|uniref:tetratricopeptide repeat protein n=2 Tax=Reichenbachiella sp. TaxID=2184521 RepID=UPI003267032E